MVLSYIRKLLWLLWKFHSIATKFFLHKFKSFPGNNAKSLCEVQCED